MRILRQVRPLLLLAALTASGCASARFQPPPAATPRPAPPAAVPAAPDVTPGARFALFPDGSAADTVRQAALAPAPPKNPVPPARIPDGALSTTAPPFPAARTHPFAGFGHTVLRDAKFVLGSPLRWDRSDWLKFSVAVAGILATAHFDEPLAHYAESHRTPGADRIAKGVQNFGEYGAFAVLGGFYLAGTALHDDTAREVAADGVVSSLIAGGLVTPLIKAVIKRGRPRDTGGEEDIFTAPGSNASFPSGHTTEAFAVASVIAGHYPQPWVKGLSYGIAGLVGLARIEQDAHFASDVVAGALIGTLVGQAVVHFNDEQRGHTGLTVSAGPFVARAGTGVAVHLHF